MWIHKSPFCLNRWSYRRKHRTRRRSKICSCFNFSLAFGQVENKNRKRSYDGVLRPDRIRDSTHKAARCSLRGTRCGSTLFVSVEHAACLPVGGTALLCFKRMRVERRSSPLFFYKSFRSRINVVRAALESRKFISAREARGKIKYVYSMSVFFYTVG